MISNPNILSPMLPEVLDRLDRLETLGAISSTAVGEFQANLIADGSGVKITFTLRNSVGIKKLSLRRNTTLDFGSAKEVSSWNAPFKDGTGFSWLDQDQVLKGATGNYWLVATNDDDAQEQKFGPQSATLNSDVGVPDQIQEFDVSLGPPVAGVGAFATQQVNISIVPPATRYGSVRILVAGYNGIAGYVAIAQSATFPFSFKIQRTGEAVTFKAITVSPAGTPAIDGPTKSLTLNGVETVPTQVLVLEADELATGVQIAFTPGVEADITTFQIWRAIRNAGFGAAANIGSVAPTGAWRYTYLDTGGLAGQFEWYVVAVGPAGSSPASAPVTNIALNTSADLPPNVPTNNTNFATVDSIDNGVNATIRVYGIAGVGSSWTRPTGFGTQTFPSLSQAGFIYGTTYYVVYDTKLLIYNFVTTFPLTLPDNLIWVGKVLTVAAGGAGGTSGGGGTGGGAGGCVEVGTPVEVPEGTTEELRPCCRWVVVEFPGKPPIKMDPDTLVSVFKKARELAETDRFEAGADGRWRDDGKISWETRMSQKVKRSCPGGTYRAGEARLRLHNAKTYEA